MPSSIAVVGVTEPLGKDALQRALARMGHADITVHGTARSTFRDWAAERTAFSYAARELALAHVVHSKQSRAYERTDLLDERRRLMEAWATFCAAPGSALAAARPLVRVSAPTTPAAAILALVSTVFLRGTG